MGCPPLVVPKEYHTRSPSSCTLTSSILYIFSFTLGFSGLAAQWRFIFVSFFFPCYHNSPLSRMSPTTSVGLGAIFFPRIGLALYISAGGFIEFSWRRHSDAKKRYPRFINFLIVCSGFLSVSRGTGIVHGFGPGVFYFLWAAQNTEKMTLVSRGL